MDWTTGLWTGPWTELQSNCACVYPTLHPAGSDTGVSLYHAGLRWIQGGQLHLPAHLKEV